MVIDQKLKQLALHINFLSSFCCSNDRCTELSKELANQKEEFCQQATRVREELESKGGALQRRLGELERERDGKRMLHYFNLSREKYMLSHCFCVSALLQLVSEKDKRIDESFRQSETLRQGLIIEFSIISLHPVQA